MIIVSGKTFDIKERLKLWGGKWSQKERLWTFDYLNADQLSYLRSVIGVSVTDINERLSKLIKPDDEDDPDLRVSDDALRFRRTGYRTFKRPNEPHIIGDDPTHLNTFANDKPIAFFGFSSLHKLCDHIARLEEPKHNIDGYCNVGWSTHSERRKVTATKDMGEALQLARYGWTEGFGIAHLFDIPHAERKARTNALAGGSVNVGRMLSGNPKHMTKRLPQPKNKRITLFVDVVMWQGILAENAMLRALLIASVIDQLEHQGYTCEIYACSASCSFHDRGAQSNFAVKVKAAGERLSLLDISFALGHPSFLRRFKFACEGSVPDISIGVENRGLISDLFTEDHPPPPNSYVFERLASNKPEYSDPYVMLDDILPDNLPIEIMRSNR